MKDYDEEQREIVEKVRTFKGTSTEKGDQCEELIKEKLQKRIDERGFSVVRQKRIKGVTEHPKKPRDLLVVKVEKGTDEYEINDVLHIIEVKKSYLKPDGIVGYRELKDRVADVDVEKNTKFSFIHIDDISHRDFFDDEEYFLLSDEKGKIRQCEWGKFVERIKDSLLG